MPALLPQLTGLWALEPRIMARVVEALSAGPQAAASMEASDPAPYQVEAGVALIPLHGVMMKGGGWLLSLFGGTDTAHFTGLVNQAAQDPAVKAILLDIDSPGGSVAGCTEAADAVSAAGKLKPTYAYVGDCCASAAYWVGSQARAMHGSAGAMVGAIGVYSSLEDSSAMAERVGVKVHVVASGAYKGAGEPGTPLTAEHLADAQRMVDTVAGLFTKAVSKGRKMSADAVSKLADGRCWYGKDAVGKGLLDGVTSRAAVVQALKAYHPGRKAVTIAAEAAGEKPMSLWDQFKAALGGGDDPAAGTTAPASYSLGTGTLLSNPGADALAAANTDIQAHAAEIAAQKATLDAQKSQIEALQAAHAAAIVAANRAACEAHMKAGRFPAADLEKQIERRATAPAIFDELMAERPQIPLTTGAISGDDAVARVDPTASASFLEDCKAYLRGQNPRAAAQVQTGAK